MKKARQIANKIANHWYKEIHGKTAPIFSKQKLRDYIEAELTGVTGECIVCHKEIEGRGYCSIECQNKEY